MGRNENTKQEGKHRILEGAREESLGKKVKIGSRNLKRKRR